MIPNVTRRTRPDFAVHLSSRCHSGLRSAKQCLRRPGISLLEVILALSILAVATAYLAGAMEQATSNALKAQKLTQAELVAESVMNQMIAGVIPAEASSWTPYYNSVGQTDWMYQIQQVPAEIQGMLSYRISVQEVDPKMGLVQTQVDLYANRWIIDPALGLDTPIEETDYGDEGYGGEGYGGGLASSSSSGAAGSAGGFGAGGPSVGTGGGGGRGAGGPGGGNMGGRGAGRGGNAGGAGTGRAGGNARGGGAGRTGGAPRGGNAPRTGNAPRASGRPAGPAAGAPGGFGPGGPGGFGPGGPGATGRAGGGRGR